MPSRPGAAGGAVAGREVYLDVCSGVQAASPALGILFIIICYVGLFGGGVCVWFGGGVVFWPFYFLFFFLSQEQVVLGKSRLISVSIPV